MSEKLVIGIYLVGMLAMLAGMAVVVCRLVGFWIEAPVEIILIGGFILALCAKLMASRIAKGTANG